MDLRYKYQSLPSILMQMHHMIQPTMEEATSLAPRPETTLLECALPLQGCIFLASVEQLWNSTFVPGSNTACHFESKLQRHHFCCFWNVNYLHLSIYIFTL